MDLQHKIVHNAMEFNIYLKISVSILVQKVFMELQMIVLG
jgi:hypothetical protein